MSASGPEAGGPSKRTLGIIIGTAGALVVILVIALIVALTSGADPAPVPSPTPTLTTATPTPTSSPTPGIPAAIRSFGADANTVTCPAATGLVQVALSWKVEHAVKVAIASAPQQEDAIVHPFENNLPASEDRFLIPFSCANERWSYTLSAVGADKTTVSQVITISRTLAPPAPTPTPTPTPTKPPAPTPTPTPEPPAPAPYVVSFTATPDAISCEAGETFTLQWEVANLGADDSVLLAVHTKENVILLGLDAIGSIDVPSDELGGFCDAGEETYWLSVTDGKTFADRQGVVVVNLDDDAREADGEDGDEDD